MSTPAVEDFKTIRERMEQIRKERFQEPEPTKPAPDAPKPGAPTPTKPPHTGGDVSDLDYDDYEGYCGDCFYTELIGDNSAVYEAECDYACEGIPDLS